METTVEQIGEDVAVQPELVAQTTGNPDQSASDTVMENPDGVENTSEDHGSTCNLGMKKSAPCSQVQPTDIVDATDVSNQCEPEINTLIGAEVCSLPTAKENTIKEITTASVQPLFKVHGIENIPKDRWRLKCSVCQWKGPRTNDLGACIQCTRGKCVRAYHVTCAMLAGILVEMDDNGVLTSYCPQHDPVFPD